MDDKKRTLLALLKNHPVFSQLNAAALDDLVALSEFNAYPPKAEITKQNDPVDFVGFLLQGTAIVTNQNQEVLAQLNPGDAIGLNEVGLYSPSGLRTANVIAQSKVLMALIRLEKLQVILRRYPAADAVLKNSADLFLRIQFIKETLPFAKINPKQLAELAKKLEQVEIKKESVLFKQGDEGEECYLIRSGEIELTATEANETRTLAILDAGDLLGEAALLLGLPRNASAKALTDAVLLRMPKSIFKELLQHEATIETIKLIHTSRIRPSHSSNVDTFITTSAAGERFLTLRNNVRGTYYRLPQQASYLWEQLDGFKSAYDLTIDFYNRYQLFKPDMISSLLVDLHAGGFVTFDPFPDARENKEIPLWMRSFTKLRSFFEFKKPLINMDGWLTKIYNKYIWIVFTKPMQLLLLFLALFGFCVFIAETISTIQFLKHTTNKWLMLILVLIATAWTILPHELAHAFTTKYFKRRIHTFGIGWMWVAPYAYCDTSDMWLNPAKDRMLVDLAGPYSDFVIASIAALFIPICVGTGVDVFLWLFALFNYLLVLTNLNPMLRLDGYYTLMDSFDRHNLREASVTLISKALKNPGNLFVLIKQNKVESFYWLCCLIYLLISASIPYLISYHLLGGLYGIHNPLLSLFIGLLTAVFSGLSMWIDVSYKMFREE